MQGTTLDREVDHLRDRRLAALILVLYGFLLLLADLVGVREQAGAETTTMWSLVHLAAVAILAFGILRARPWAWWGALVLASVALFLLAPIGIALVAGSGLPVLVPTIHLVLVTLEGLSLLALIALLARMGWRRRATQP